MVDYIDDIMLNESGEQEATSTLDALVKHNWIERVVDNSYKNSGTCHLSDVSGNPMIWSMSRHSLQGERHKQNEESAWYPFLEATYSTSE